MAANKAKILYADLRFKINRFFYTKIATILELTTTTITLLDQTQFGRMETSFQKIYKGTSHFILIMHWSHKT